MSAWAARLSASWANRLRISSRSSSSHFSIALKSFSTSWCWCLSNWIAFMGPLLSGLKVSADPATGSAQRGPQAGRRRLAEEPHQPDEQQREADHDAEDDGVAEEVLRHGR